MTAAVQTAAEGLIGDVVQDQRLADGDVVRELESCADRGVDDDFVRRRACRTAVAEAHGTGRDIEAVCRVVPAGGGVVGEEFEDAVVVLVDRDCRRGDDERGIDAEDRSGRDFKGGICRLQHVERAARAPRGARGAETEAGRAVHLEGDGVGDVAERAVAGDGEHAVEDVDRGSDTAEGIAGIGERERAGAGLHEGEGAAHVRDHAAEREALDDVRRRADADCDVRGSGEGGGSGEFEAVAVRGHHTDDAAIVRQVDFLKGLVAGIGGAGILDSDRRVCGQRHVAAKVDALHRAEPVAVRQEGKTTGDVERSGVVADRESAGAGLEDIVRGKRRSCVRDGDGHLRRSHRGIPRGRERGDAVEGDVVRSVEDVVADSESVICDGDIVRDRDRGGGDHRGVVRQRQHAGTDRTTGDDHSRAGDAAISARGAACAKRNSACGDIHAAGEGARRAAEAEDACAGLHDATVLDDGGDIQASLPRGDISAIDDGRTDRDRVGGVRIEIHRAAGDRGDRAGAAHRGRDAAAAREGQNAGRVQGRLGAAVVVDRQIRQRVIAREGHDTAAVEGQRLGRQAGAGDRLGQETVVHRDAAGTERATGADDHVAGVDHCSAGVGIRSGQNGVADACGFDLACGKDCANCAAIIGDGRADGRRPARAGEAAVVDEEAAAAGRAGEVSVRDREVNVVGRLTEQEAAALEGQRVAAEVQHCGGGLLAEGEGVHRGIGTQQRRARRVEADVINRSRAAREADSRVVREAGVVQAAHTVNRVIAREITIRHRPCADDVVRQRRGRSDDQACSAADLAARVEADGGRGVRASQRGDSDIEGVDARVAGIGGEGAVTTRESDRAEGLGRGRLSAACKCDGAARQGDGSRVADAIGDRDQVGVTNGECAVADLDRLGRVRQAGGVIQGERAAGDEGRSGVSLRSREVQRAGAGLVQVDGSGDDTAEVRVAVDGQGRERAGVRHDAAAQVRACATRLGGETGHKLVGAVQVQRAACVDRKGVVEEQRVRHAGGEVHRAAVDGGRAADELLRIQIQRAGEGLRQTGRAGESGGNVEGLASLDMDEAFRAEGDDRDVQERSRARAAALGKDGTTGERQGRWRVAAETADGHGPVDVVERQGVDGLVGSQRVQRGRARG